MFAVEELGWTELGVNQPVFEIGSSTLGLLGIVDLLDVEAGLALDYDGVRWRTQDAGHRDREQHRADNRSRDRWTLDEPEHWIGLPA